jgi:hypothetical protein
MLWDWQRRNPHIYTACDKIPVSECWWVCLQVIFIVAPCILKIQWVLHTNECTNYILYISLKFFYIKTLKMLLHVSIPRSSSGSTYCSLLKLHGKIVNMSLYLSVMWQYIMCLCMHCLQYRREGRLATVRVWYCFPLPNSNCSQSTYLPALKTMHKQTHDMLPHHW